VEKSNPRARSNTERPVNRLPAPGLETTSTIKLVTASADSGHPDFPPGTGVRPRTSWAWKVGDVETALTRHHAGAGLQASSTRELPLLPERVPGIWPVRGPLRPVA
jgi:hypothetical protein